MTYVVGTATIWFVRPCSVIDKYVAPTTKIPDN